LKVPKEFKINEYITLKLEYERTNIYIKGKLFQQCAYLLINIPLDKAHSFDDINSIDEAAERLDHSLENTRFEEISPETEFWGHCSNLQAWAEHNYDTRLLHSNISFPLLKRLVKVGDPKAKRVFKEEVFRRFLSGNLNVITFILQQRYLHCFSSEELETLFRELFDSKKLSNRSIIALNILKQLWQTDDAKILKILKREIIKEFQSKGSYLIEFIITENLQRHFSQEEISEIIDKFNSLKIQKLNFRDSSLKTIPDWIGELKPLKRFDLSGNKFRAFPKLIFELNNLEMLNLDKNKIVYAPRKIGTLRSLRELKLRNNNLKIFPEAILDLSNLEHLDLAINRIENFPGKFLYQLTLDYFFDSGNRKHPKVYPHSLEIFSNLKVLSLRGNGINRFPNFINDFTSLMSLDLSWNEILRLPKSLGTLRSLRSLDFKRNKIVKIPESIGALKDLEILRLGNNRLSGLPESLRDLKSLKELSLLGNKFEAIPAFIGSLQSLEKLGFEFNFLSTVPESIGDLDNLRELHLEGNDIKRIPDSLGNLKSLEVLTLNSNELSELPLSIGNLTSLKTLNLDSNKIKRLLSSIGGLNSLEMLDLNNNRLSNLPKELLNLRSLKDISIRNNPLNSRSIMILEVLKEKGISVVYKDLSENSVDTNSVLQ
jgi:Leucine-rich repeat (LRR) protein